MTATKPTPKQPLPWATLLLTAIITAAFTLQQDYLPAQWLRAHHFYAVPMDIMTALQIFQDSGSPWHLAGASGGFFSALFLHSTTGLFLGNLLFLGLLGAGVEPRLGAWRTLLIFVAGGVAGEITYGLVEQVALAGQVVPYSYKPWATIGASPGLFALAGAYLHLWWSDISRTGKLVFPLGVSVVACMILRDVLSMVYFTTATSAHSSHAGGLLAGLALAWLLSWLLSRAVSTGSFRK
jgi:membrane associated rhomboid family serine protease